MEKLSEIQVIGGVSALAAAIVTVTILVMNQALGD
jgi:hypothetical protein